MCDVNAEVILPVAAVNKSENYCADTMNNVNINKRLFK